MFWTPNPQLSKQNKETIVELGPKYVPSKKTKTSMFLKLTQRDLYILDVSLYKQYIQYV